MRSSKGSILAITVGFALVFTMLGIASIYISTLQSETQEKQILSQKAFWLAEAGIQRAITSLVIGTPSYPVVVGSLGDGTYSAIITRYQYPDGTFSNNRWNIVSSGSIVSNGSVLSVRTIKVEVGANIIHALQTTGTLKPGSEDQIDGTIAEKSTFLFPDIFQKSFDINAFKPPEVDPPGAQVLTNPGNSQNVDDAGVDLVDGIIWVNGNFKITSGWDYSGILIVNGDFEMTGGSFKGILW